MEEALSLLPGEEDLNKFQPDQPEKSTSPLLATDEEIGEAGDDPVASTHALLRLSRWCIMGASLASIVIFVSLLAHNFTPQKDPEAQSKLVGLSNVISVGGGNNGVIVGGSNEASIKSGDVNAQKKNTQTNYGGNNAMANGDDATSTGYEEGKGCEGSGNGGEHGAAQVVCCYSPSGAGCCGSAAVMKGFEPKVSSTCPRDTVKSSGRALDRQLLKDVNAAARQLDSPHLPRAIEIGGNNNGVVIGGNNNGKVTINQLVQDLESACNSHNRQTFGSGTFCGQMENGKPNGLGELIAVDGIIYKGTFKDGKLHGKCSILYKSEDDKSRGKVYKGQCKDNKPEGAGTLDMIENGKVVRTFEGSFVNGVKDGPGKWTTHANGHAWEGDYKDGKQISGTEYDADGEKQVQVSKYGTDGAMKEGKLFLASDPPDRVAYDGQLDPINTEAEGHGTRFFYIDESRPSLITGKAEGEFKNGKPRSYAKFSEYRLNKKAHRLVNYYDGEIDQHYQAQGQGTWYLGGNNKFVGSFESGHPVKGVLYANGVKYEGPVQNDFQPNGKHITVTLPSGRTYKDKEYFNGAMIDKGYADDWISMMKSSTKKSVVYNGQVCPHYIGFVDDDMRPHGRGRFFTENIRFEGFYRHGDPIYGALWFKGTLLYGPVDKHYRPNGVNVVWPQRGMVMRKGYEHGVATPMSMVVGLDSSRKHRKSMSVGDMISGKNKPPKHLFQAACCASSRGENDKKLDKLLSCWGLKDYWGSWGDYAENSLENIFKHDKDYSKKFKGLDKELMPSQPDPMSSFSR